VKQLIVNADDFGLTRGVTLGVLEAHEHGIVTSASLMVDAPDAVEAARLSHAFPELSVGLHVTLTDEYENVIGADCCEEELDRQYACFHDLMGHPPTHIDVHHNVHRDARLAPQFGAFASRVNLPLRGRSPARYVPSFYGQWDGQTHPTQISIEGLRRVLTEEATSDINELGCHPGYVDGDLRSYYANERALELRTLCSPRARSAVTDLGFELVSFVALGPGTADLA